MDMRGAISMTNTVHVIEWAKCYFPFFDFILVLYRFNGTFYIALMALLQLCNVEQVFLIMKWTSGENETLFIHKNSMHSVM